MFERRKECVAMLLAGGQGKRLMVLTENVAKPAIPFGGKYRIIDFSLSNCVNSNIDTVGVLTQYQPHLLNSYIGNGQPWGLSRSFGGVHVLPPYAGSEKSEWYQGTANAVFQNIRFIDMHSPEYVLILSGDHIYTMDYSKMLDYHKEKNADCTIAVLDVSLEEASRFGIMNTNEDGSIYEFEEKPEHPKSTQASMGVYIFTWSVLKKYLIEDENDPNSSKDFGKNIIPNLLKDGQKLVAYPFEGYWRDVGTIDSLWEANMDLLAPKPPLNLYDPKWKIYAKNYAEPATYLAEGSAVKESLVSQGCSIEGTIERSIISGGCIVEKGAVVKNSIVMAGTHIKSGAIIEYAIIGEDAVIEEKARVGEPPEACTDRKWGISVVGAGKVVSSGTALKAREMV